MHLMPKIKVWVLVGPGQKLGTGRAELLQAIDELGSLQKAAARFGMSYRYAWGVLRALERELGTPLVERVPGGRRGGGSRLTRQARELLSRYRRFQEALQRHGAREFRRIFGADGR